MTLSRRSFLSSSLAASSLLALPKAQDKPQGARSANDPAARKLKILVFGGTGFLGPSIVRPALERGHTVTLFNRGRSRPYLFPDVERIVGDQDPKKGEGLKNLEKAVADGRTWDAVVDDIAQYPVLLRPRLAALQKAASHWVLISSISAYAKTDRIGGAEDGELCKLADEDTLDIGKNFENYGGLKAACERTAEKAFPGRCTNIRPGFIVGPEDYSDRFTYWPVRYDKGGEMLWPGTPQDPIQIIDVRDLGAWIVHVLEEKTYGVFNACGPDENGWSMGALLAACKAASKADTKPVWVPADFLDKNGLEGDAGIPIWIKPEGATKGFHRFSNAKAKKAGLVLRDPAKTTADTLAWFKTLPAPAPRDGNQPTTQRAPTSRDNKLRAGISEDAEKKVLAAFAQQK